MKKIVFVVLGIAMTAMVSCKKESPPPSAPEAIVKTGGRQLSSAGIKFLIPWEEGASHSDTPDGLFYESPFLKVTMGNGKLFVNTTNYGPVKSGDVVNLLNKGRVFVNDVERKPQ